MRGIYNIGNTCYLASALKCLLNIPPLSNFFLSFPYEGDCEITSSYSKLVYDVWDSTQTTPVRIDDFLKLFSRTFKQFKGHQQQDSQEVIIRLFETFENSHR